MPTIPVHAYGFSATFHVRELVRALPDATVRADAVRDRAVAHFPAAEGEVKLAILHDFGAAVFFGLDRAASDRLVAHLIARLAPEPHAPLTEHFLIEVRPGAATEVKFDRAVVPSARLLDLELVSLLLAQSVVLDYYEEDVGEILQRTQVITSGLAQRGRIPGRVRNLRQFIGSCISTRADVVLSLALFDKPESTWDDAEADRLFRGLRTELEIDDRFRAIERKLGMIQDDLVLFVELSQTRSSWRLEMIIVVLILLELLISLVTLVNGQH